MTVSKIASKFRVILKDLSYDTIARFDSWNALSYTKKVNDVGSYKFDLPYNDPRISMFKLDSIMIVERSLPGLNIPYYPEFVGLMRGETYEVNDTGKQTFSVTGASPNDLLSRRIINYSKATIKSEKSAVAETAICEYVEENCGPTATIAWNREIAGTIPDFFVDPSAGRGILWEGDRAYENLLDVVKDIAKFSSLDFEVLYDDVLKMFGFKVFSPIYGLNKSIEEIDRNTGLNVYGNVPVLFSLEKGNVKNLKYVSDRMGEVNVVSVLGDGDGATRLVEVVTSPAMTDSPLNQREISRPQGGFISQMQTTGNEVIEDMKAKVSIEFQPLLQESCMYGVHFDIGDIVSVRFRGITESKKIVSVTNTVDTVEKLQFVFEPA